jgi:hypothetical protein
MTDEHGEGVSPQWFGVPPTQVPLSQVSLMVQNLPSSHALPFGDGTTTQVFSGPITCPMLHTAIVHGGVSNPEQSTPQGPRSPPPAPPPPPSLGGSSVIGASPGTQVQFAAFPTSGSKSKILRKFLMRLCMT